MSWAFLSGRDEKRGKIRRWHPRQRQRALTASTALASLKIAVGRRQPDGKVQYIDVHQEECSYQCWQRFSWPNVCSGQCRPEKTAVWLTSTTAVFLSTAGCAFHHALLRCSIFSVLKTSLTFSWHDSLKYWCDLSKGRWVYTFSNSVNLIKIWERAQYFY